jgi:folate-binding Fe-S cluster repair protein YgfZ
LAQRPAARAKFLGANARRLYKVQAPAKFIRERVSEIERPDWWPTDEEVRAALRPEAAVTRG